MSDDAPQRRSARATAKRSFKGLDGEEGDDGSGDDVGWSSEDGAEAAGRRRPAKRAAQPRARGRRPTGLDDLDAQARAAEAEAAALARQGEELQARVAALATENALLKARVAQLEGGAPVVLPPQEQLQAAAAALPVAPEAVPALAGEAAAPPVAALPGAAE